MTLGSIKPTMTQFGVLCSLLALLFCASSRSANAFGKQVACENSFAGAVYFDQNLDGTHDLSESYLPGQIEIVDDLGVIQQAIESSDGTFGAQQLACNTYRVHHNHVAVGAVVIGEIMTQEVKMFPKVQTMFFPMVAYKARLASRAP